ncbi:MAG: T9SS type A sorting domain-containing protein [Flavobacterium sp.]|nr:T9SS type A sorting domain-containing protein [Flavobacterium sp.]
MIKIEAETLKSGVYFLKLMSDSEVVTKSIIIGQ